MSFLLTMIQSLLWGFVFYLAFLPSQSGVLLGLYSFKKFVVLCFLIFLSLVLFIGHNRIAYLLSKSISVSMLERVLNGLMEHPVRVFTIFATLLYLPDLVMVAVLAGDITIQSTSAIHKHAGLVDEYNCYLTIDREDWSKDAESYTTWWPPGFLMLLDPVLSTGISFGWALKIIIYIAFISGGTGFIVLIQRFRLSRKTAAVFAFLLPLYIYTRTGLSTSMVMTVDFLGFAIFPWLTIAALGYWEKVSQEPIVKLKSYALTLLLFPVIGLMYYIKNTWFIYACGLATYICLRVLYFNYSKKSVLQGVHLCAIAVLAFAIPVVSLEYSNYLKTGRTAISHAVSEDPTGGNWYDQMYGEHYTKSTQGSQLFVSTLCSPGWLAFGHDFFINASYLLGTTSLVADIADWFSPQLNNLILCYMLFALMGNAVLWIFLYRFRTAIRFEYWLFVIVLMFVTVVFFTLHAYQYKTANPHLNFDTRYRVLFNILIEVTIIQVVLAGLIQLSNLVKRILFLKLLVVTISYPLLLNGFNRFGQFTNNLSWDQQTTNGIKSETYPSGFIQKRLSEVHHQGSSVFFFCANHCNIAPLDFAEKTVFASTHTELNSLFDTYRSSKKLRLLLLIEKEKSVPSNHQFEKWARKLNSEQTWRTVELNEIEDVFLYYIDAGITL